MVTNQGIHTSKNYISFSELKTLSINATTQWAGSLCMTKFEKNEIIIFL